MSEQGLYQKRIPIFIRTIKGKFRTFKTAILILAYSIFFGLPWLPWERPYGSRQAVEFDLKTKIYYVFDLAINVQSIFLLAGLLIVFAWLLFFVTSILGRVFCGYFCFQTLWTDAFMKIEVLIQGERNKRLKLYNGPWNQEKLIKVGGTWLFWLLLAFWSGFTFTAYWGDARTLFIQFFTAQAPYPAYFCTFLLTALTFTMAGFAREQVCTYMCPYGRFQSAMFDKNTLIITYDQKRGENALGRVKPIKDLKSHEQRSLAGYGDCIDCDLCVQVCPTGIDIRDGLQYRCISCGLCVDACNQVMKKSNFPLDLVRYSSDNELQGGKTRILRPKSIGYFVAIMLVFSVIMYGLLHTPIISYSVLQTRQPLMVQLSDGNIQNSYEVKLNNLSLSAQKIKISIEGLESAQLKMDFHEFTLMPNSRLSVIAKVIQKADVEHKKKEQTFNFKLIVDEQNNNLLQSYLLKAAFYRGSL